MKADILSCAAALCAAVLSMPSAHAQGSPDPDTVAAPQARQAQTAAPFWVELQAARDAVSSVQAQFSERREVPFRKRDTHLSGTLRYAKAHGLSLHYATLQPVTLVFDAEGLLRKTDPDAGRELPLPEALESLQTTLVDLLSLDFAALDAAFVLEGAQSGATWSMELTPRADAPLDGWLRRIELEGEGVLLTAMTLVRGNRQRTHFRFSEHALNAGFTEAERAAYFRQP